jgi:thioredoxin 1
VKLSYVATGILSVIGSLAIQSGVYANESASCLTTVARITSEILGVAQEKITMNSSFIDDLGGDSLDSVELCEAFEREFRISIPDAEAEKMCTPGDVIRYLDHIGVCLDGVWKPANPVKSEGVTLLTLKVTQTSFQTDVIRFAEPVVVSFWAEWCGPCKQMAPELEEIAVELNGKLKIAKLNVDENPGIAAKYGVRSIPTLMIFKNGKYVATKTGAGPKSELLRWISAAL